MMAEYSSEAECLATTARGRAVPRDRLLGDLAILAAETIDATLRVDQTLLTRVKGVAGSADVNGEIAPGGPRLKMVAAGAGHRDDLVVGVNAFLHGLAPGREP